MKRYRIQGKPNQAAYFDILEELDNGYRVRVTRVNEGRKKTLDEFMDNYLFDLCVKTEYIREIAREAEESMAENSAA
jgi:hypothetical protein